MSSLSFGLVIAASALVFLFLSGGRRWRWVLPVVVLCLVIGLLADFWFKQLPQSFFAALPLPVTSQASAANLLGFIGVGGAVALIVRGALAALPGRLKGEKAPGQPE